MLEYQGRGRHVQVVQSLGIRITSGDLTPGEILDLIALEAEFGISKTVMREALKVLSAKGLVRARQRLGTYVTDREEWHLLDPTVLAWEMTGRDPSTVLAMLSEVRSMIEPRAAELAAQRHNEADLEAMDTALTAMADSDKQSAIAGDIAFHRALISAAHNDILQRMGLLIESLLSARGHLVHDTVTTDSAIPMHRVLRDAIANGDAARAQSQAVALIGQARGDEHLIFESGETAP